MLSRILLLVLACAKLVLAQPPSFPVRPGVTLSSCTRATGCTEAQGDYDGLYEDEVGSVRSGCNANTCTTCASTCCLCDCTFGNLACILPPPPSPPSGGGSGESGGSSIVIVIVVAVAVVAIVAILGAVFYLTRRSSTATPPASSSQGREMPAQAVIGMPQPSAPTGPPAASGSGARFDVNTGKPIPKFDPETGKQNWWDGPAEAQGKSLQL